MHLTKRFFAMNMLAVLLSIGLTALAAVVFIAVYTKAFGRDMYWNEFKRAYEVRTAIQQLKREAQTYEFDRLLDDSYRQELAGKAKASGAYAVVVKGREVLFTTLKLSEIEVEQSLMLTGSAHDRDTLELNGQTYVFARAAYKLPTGEDGILLLLAPINPNNNHYVWLGVFIAVIFIVVFMLMNAWVSYTFSRGIIMPVSRLKRAAAKISEGELDFGIAEEGEGEVRELSRTLEFMRLKLKESVYWQQKYDENRTFLISSISHDLKTPVASIRGYIEGIMDGVANTPEKMEEYLQTASSKAILVNTMIEDLLLYSKLDLNQLPFHFERTDPAAYFEDCAADYQYEFNKANIRLGFRNELANPAVVLIDRERLKRVVQNILDNAAKYSDKINGQVDIVLRETPVSVIIEVSDNGKGIAEEDLPHIFERFYRADPARKNADGSGLGLAIAKQIVEGHQGKIWARSVIGQGSRIMMSLPKL